MTLETIYESDVRKAGDKEKRSGLRLVDESNIKKVWNQEKKSWLNIVEESGVREDPKIELVDKSDVRKVGEKVKKPELEFVVKERIIKCERQRAGMINNCVLCKELNKDTFNRCSNKYRGF